MFPPPPAAATALRAQAAAARALHMAAGTRQRQLDASGREKEQLVKALVRCQA